MFVVSKTHTPTLTFTNKKEREEAYSLYLDKLLFDNKKTYTPIILLVFLVEKSIAIGQLSFG